MIYKYCPDLITKQWNKASLRGNGDFQSINLNECLGKHCVAFNDGICEKYKTVAIADEQMVHFSEELADVIAKKVGRT